MHDESGPPRLRQGSDTPEALLRAIDALRKGVDDSARMSRVGQKLEGVLNAPPTAAAVKSGSVSTFKLILGGLALLAALAPLFFFQHADDGAVPGADRHGSSEVAQPQVEVAPQPAAQEQVAAIEEPAAVESAQPQHARRSAKHAARTRERNSVHEATAERDEPAVNERPSEAAPAATQPMATSEHSETSKDSQRSGEKLTQPEESPAIPAEADLLLKARKALKLDPNLALRLAAEHQSYYPKGRLVPEREVLAIEALRNLGRKQEADERLKKFEARYPKSIHLQRLHESN